MSGVREQVNLVAARLGRSQPTHIRIAQRGEAPAASLERDEVIVPGELGPCTSHSVVHELLHLHLGHRLMGKSARDHRAWNMLFDIDAEKNAVKIAVGIPPEVAVGEVPPAGGGAMQQIMRGFACSLAKIWRGEEWVAPPLVGLASDAHGVCEAWRREGPDASGPRGRALHGSLVALLAPVPDEEIPVPPPPPSPARRRAPSADQASDTSADSVGDHTVAGVRLSTRAPRAVMAVREVTPTPDEITRWSDLLDRLDRTRQRSRCGRIDPRRLPAAMLGNRGYTRPSAATGALVLVVDATASMHRGQLAAVATAVLARGGRVCLGVTCVDHEGPIDHVWAVEERPAASLARAAAVGNGFPLRRILLHLASDEHPSLLLIARPAHRNWGPDLGEPATVMGNYHQAEEQAALALEEAGTVIIYLDGPTWREGTFAQLSGGPDWADARGLSLIDGMHR